MKDMIYNMKMTVPLPIRIFIKRLGSHDLATFSACTTYYLVLALVPTLITLMAILPFTPLDAKTLIQIINLVTPDFAHGIVASFINAAYTQSVSLLSGSIIAAIWSASKGMLGLMNGLNNISQVTEKRNFIYIRVWAIIYTLALMAVFLGMLVLLVFGDQIFQFFQKALPELEAMWEYLMRFRMVFVLLPAMILIAFMYTFIPMKHILFRKQLIGALFCTVGWGVFSVAFSFYVTYFSSHSIYGSLATPMMLMLWLYFCVYILFLGAVINEALDEWLHSEYR